MFGDELIELSRKSDLDKILFTLTDADAKWTDVVENDPAATHVERRYGRQLQDFLNSAPRHVLYFVCGPPKMIDETVELLKNKGIPDEDIRYEKWW